MLPRRPRLALPFTILPGPGRVRLVAGEDFRYTLTGPGLENWLPGWLPLLDGRLTPDEALGHLAVEHHESARSVLLRLSGERVLVEGPLRTGSGPQRFRFAVEGQGALRVALEKVTAREDPTGPVLAILTQDRLDLEEAIRFNARCLAGTTPWLWLTTGPLARGYVGPLFLPDAGPCLACLLGHFQRLSPLPELYDELVNQSRRGGTIAPVPFPDYAVALLVQLALGKVDWLNQAEPPAALYQLHVLELDTLEISVHRVFIDPECHACGGRR